MARPKSADEALEAIEQEARWRRRELDLLYQNLLGAKEEARNSLIRSYVLALYAHWEGLIKRCSEVYLSYLSELLARRNISVSQLVVPLQSTVLLRLYVTASGKDGAKKYFLD